MLYIFLFHYFFYITLLNYMYKYQIRSHIFIVKNAYEHFNNLLVNKTRTTCIINKAFD